MTRQGYKMTTIDLFPGQYTALKQFAASQLCPMTDIMRYAVDEFLIKHCPGYTSTQDGIRKYKENNMEEK